MMTRAEFDRMVVIGLRGVFFLVTLALPASMIVDAWTFTPSSAVRVNRDAVVSATLGAVFVWVFLKLYWTPGKLEPKSNRVLKLSTVGAFATQLGSHTLGLFLDAEFSVFANRSCQRAWYV